MKIIEKEGKEYVVLWETDILVACQLIGTYTNFIFRKTDVTVLEDDGVIRRLTDEDSD